VCNILSRLGAAAADAVAATLIAIAELAEALRLRRMRKDGYRPPCPDGCRKHHLHMRSGDVYWAPLDKPNDWRPIGRLGDPYEPIDDEEDQR
jgi:hypothetical protein